MKGAEVHGESERDERQQLISCLDLGGLLKE